MHTYIVIPAKNEAARIGGVLAELRLLGFDHIVVVDDGSADDTAQIAASFGAYVLQHTINLGAGAATQTGISYALFKNADIIATIDADHQHNPGDIPRLIEKLHAENAAIVIGSRFMDKSNAIPFSRRLYNWIGNIVSYIVTGMMVSDSQSGLKVFTADFARSSHLSYNGFEFCIEFIRNARHLKAKLVETPIHVTYTKETMRKGQSLLSGFRMIGRLIRF